MQPSANEDDVRPVNEDPSEYLRKFARLPPAWPRIALLFTSAAALIMLATQGEVAPLPKLEISNAAPSEFMWGRLTFLLYTALFASMWVVYFCSRTDLEFFNVRTLRKLLRITSKQWLLRNPADPQPELERIYSDKARASITVLGILTAVAGLELVQVNSILLSGRWASADMGLWRVIMVDGATLAAIAAIVLLLLSADSLDSIFNRFKTDEADALLKSRFYMQSVTPRYLGLVMLMFGAVLLVAFHEPQLASMAIAVLIVAGYRHWFPRVTFGAAAGESATQPRTRETGRRVGNIIASVALILAPIFLGRVGSRPVPAPIFAVLAALLWAFSAPLVNRGLTQLPPENRLLGILCGLFVSLLSGSLTLFLMMMLGAKENLTFSCYLVLAGILTFPVATGLYYASARAFGDRAEYAAQFVKVKPVLSVLLAFWLLKESFKWSSYVSLVLIVLGVWLLWTGSAKAKWSILPVALGLVTALSWAFGEIFFKLNYQGQPTLDDTFVALASGSGVGALGVLVAWIFAKESERRKVIATTPSWLSYFVMHGVFSFGFAYACLFHAIGILGVSRSIMITTLWPMVALSLAGVFIFGNEGSRSVSARVWLSAAALLAGSLLQLLT